MKRLAALTLTIIITILTGCGDDGRAPFANAGDNQTTSLGETVTLSGSLSKDTDDDPLTYTWTITDRPTGSSAEVDSPNSETTTFTPDVDGEYVIQLTVFDGKWDDEDLTILTVLPSGFSSTDPITVLVIHSVDTLHGWQVNQALSSADFIIRTEYPSLVDQWDAGDIAATIIDVDPADAYHPERFQVINWTISKR